MPVRQNRLIACHRFCPILVVSQMKFNCCLKSLDYVQMIIGFSRGSRISISVCISISNSSSLVYLYELLKVQGSQPKDCACHKASFLNVACSAAVLLAKQRIRIQRKCGKNHFWQPAKPWLESHGLTTCPNGKLPNAASAFCSCSDWSLCLNHFAATGWKSRHSSR